MQWHGSGGYDERPIWRSWAPGFFVVTASLIFVLWIRHEPDQPPPPDQSFAGLPVTGNLASARRKGFRDCFNVDAVNIRCRRHGVMLNGHGPFEAAVDLRGSKGQHGFDHLTLWSDGDQMALYKVLPAFYRSGWRSCHTELGHWGGEAIFTRRGIPVFMSIDISYWGKRRLRMFPLWYPRTKERECLPDEDLGLFGL